MTLDLQDTEFVELNAETIRALLSSAREDRPDRRRRERRREARWPFPSTVQLWVRDRAGQEIETYATCRNMNETGLGLICERPVDVGLRVPIAIHRPDATYHGTGVIRHCTPSEGAYFIGVELMDRAD